MLLFSDVDRTLLTQAHLLPDRVEVAAKRAVGQGLQLVLTSARSPTGLRPIAERLGVGGMAICFNGGWIGDLSSGQALLTRQLAREDVALVFDLAASHGLLPIAYGESSAVALERDREAAAIQTRITTDLLIPVPTPEALPAGLFKVMCVARQPDTVQRFARVMAALPPHLDATASAGHLLEIVPMGSSKGSSAAWLADHLGLSAKECAAAGDAANDISMVTWAGTRITVANGLPELRAMADFIAPDCDSGGMADAFDWLAGRMTGATWS